MRVLITGGNGYIGSHLAWSLVRAGHEVISVDRIPPGRYRTPPGIRDVRLDLRHGGLRPHLHGIDAVVHLASSLGIKRGIEQPWDLVENNLKSTLRVLESCHGSGIRFIHGSSSAVYGMVRNSTPLLEDAPLAFSAMPGPSANYAMSKLMQEAMVNAFAAGHGSPVATARFFNCVGGGHDSDLGHVLPSFINAANRNTMLKVHGTGDQKRTFIHVSDAAHAIRILLEAPSANGPYNIGGTEEISIMDLARLVLDLTGSSSGIERVGHDTAFRPGHDEPTARVPSVDRIRALGFAPILGLRQAVERAVGESFLEPITRTG